MAEKRTANERMTPERIGDLLAPFVGTSLLTPKQLQQVLTYLNLLLKWNFKINLTAVREPEQIVARHFGESFFGARHLFADPQFATSAIDIGSGAGFPGLPLKIWAPALALTLVEANNKKVAFLREVIRALALTGVTVFAGRAESLHGRGDLVVFRAVEQFERILPIARSLATACGRLALFIGESQLGTAQTTCPDVRWNAPIGVPLSQHRVLVEGHIRE